MFEAKMAFFVLGILTVKFRIPCDTEPVKKKLKRRRSTEESSVHSSSSTDRPECFEGQT
jgi:hypothetical protein